MDGFNVVTFVDSSTDLNEFFSTDGIGCGYSGQFSELPLSEPALTSEEVLDCLAEIAVIASMSTGALCE
jgi:hypothetical protein